MFTPRQPARMLKQQGELMIKSKRRQRERYINGFRVDFAEESKCSGPGETKVSFSAG
jgi:hypothetical protein